VNPTASVSLPITTILVWTAPAVCAMTFSTAFLASVGSARKSLIDCMVMALTRAMLPAPLIWAMFESMMANDTQPRTRTSTPALDLSIRICSSRLVLAGGSSV
jgi:hypothetical protein